MNNQIILSSLYCYLFRSFEYNISLLYKLRYFRLESSPFLSFIILSISDPLCECNDIDSS